MKLKAVSPQLNLSFLEKFQPGARECVWSVAHTAAPFKTLRYRPAPQFSIKGGFMGTGSQRRMFIVGKIGKF